MLYAHSLLRRSPTICLRNHSCGGANASRMLQAKQHRREKAFLWNRRPYASQPRLPLKVMRFMDQQRQGVSVVVPTLNRGPFLIDTLHDLLAQKHRPLEILVVDQSREENPVLLGLVCEY